MKLGDSVAAVVTGGASGLGRATAAALAGAGARVTVFDLDVDAGEAVARKIDGFFCKVDITSNEDVGEGFAAARQRYGNERILSIAPGPARASRLFREAGKRGK